MCVCVCVCVGGEEWGHSGIEALFCTIRESKFGRFLDKKGHFQDEKSAGLLR